MFFRMLDSDRPYLGSFLSRIGNAADQEQNHSDNQQDKPDSESVHLRPPFPSITRRGLERHPLPRQILLGAWGTLLIAWDNSRVSPVWLTCLVKIAHAR